MTYFGKLLKGARRLILDQLRQGISPERIGMTGRLKLGAALALIFPIIGSTTLLCAGAALWLRLNQPIIQLVNYFCYPLQLALLIPFYRLGEHFGAPHLSLSIPQLIERWRAWPVAVHDGFRGHRPGRHRRLVPAGAAGGGAAVLRLPDGGAEMGLQRSVLSRDLRNTAWKRLTRLRLKGAKCSQSKAVKGTAISGISDAVEIGKVALRRWRIVQKLHIGMPTAPAGRPCTGSGRCSATVSNSLMALI